MAVPFSMLKINMLFENTVYPYENRVFQTTIAQRIKTMLPDFKIVIKGKCKNSFKAVQSGRTGLGFKEEIWRGKISKVPDIDNGEIT